MAVVAELDKKTGMVWLDSDWRWKDQIEQIPGAKWAPDKGKWRIPISWTACIALRGTIGSDLVLGEKLKAWARKEREERIDPCMALRDATSYDWGDPKLYWWQRSGAQFVKTGKQVLVADSPGTGKTATTVRGLMAAHEDGDSIFPILVVCPSSVKQSWAREFEMWWPGLTVQVVKGTAVQRKKQLAKPAHVYVMNYEAIRSHSRLAPYGSIALKRCSEHGGADPKVTATACHVHEKELNKINFGAVVVDEAHRLKEASAQQTRAVKAAAGKAKVRIALTGTPVSNDVTDLWSILNFLAPEEFASKTKWINRYIETFQNAFGGMVVLGVKADKRSEFDVMLNSRMRRVSEDQVLTFLPPIIYERRDCEMSPKQAKAYKMMADDMIASLESGTLLASSPVTQATRLLQFASSYGEIESIDEVDEFGFTKIKTKLTLTDPSAKLDAFMEDLEIFGTDQVAVMSVSRQLLELLSVRLTKAGISHGMITGTTPEDERQWAIDDFQAGRTRYILFTSGAGGVGITLTAAKYLARLQIPYNFVDYQQSLRRVRRIGAEKHDHIVVVDYVTSDTLDEHTFEVVGRKEENFEDIVKDREAVLRMLKNG